MKVKYGLKNVHFAPITEGTDGILTYATPIKLPGAVNLSLSPVSESVEFYADDSLYYSEEANNGYDGELEVALVTDEFRKEVLGEEYDEVTGVFYENVNKPGKKFALLFEFTGDAKARRHVMYYCSAQRPNLNGSTKTNTKEVQTSTFSFTARPRPTDGLVKADTNGTDAAIYDAWYQEVHEKTTEPAV
jgi:phi13 family phage major tail protein